MTASILRNWLFPRKPRCVSGTQRRYWPFPQRSISMASRIRRRTITKWQLRVMRPKYTTPGFGRSFRRGRYSTLGRRGSKRTEQSLFTIWRDAPSTCSVISPNSLMTITKRFYVILDHALAKWTFGNFRTTSPRCHGRNVWWEWWWRSLRPEC